MEIKDFKQGDKIYVIYRGNVSGIIKVDRTTRTQIICNNNQRFRIKNDRLDLVGRDSWHFYSYSIETPEQKEEYQKKTIKDKIDIIINKLDYNKTQLSDLESIYQILSKYE